MSKSVSYEPVSLHPDKTPKRSETPRHPARFSDADRVSKTLQLFEPYGFDMPATDKGGFIIRAGMKILSALQWPYSLGKRMVFKWLNPAYQREGMALALWLDNIPQQTFHSGNTLRTIFKKALCFFYLDLPLRWMSTRIENFFRTSDDLFLRCGVDRPIFELLVFLSKNALINVPSPGVDYEKLSPECQRWVDIQQALEKNQYQQFFDHVHNIFEAFSFDGRYQDKDPSRLDFTQGNVSQQRWLKQNGDRFNREDKRKLEDGLNGKRQRLKYFKKMIDACVQAHGEKAKESNDKASTSVPDVDSVSDNTKTYVRFFSPIRWLFDVMSGRSAKSTYKRLSEETHEEINTEQREIINLGKVAKSAQLEWRNFAGWASGLSNKQWQALREKLVAANFPAKKADWFPSSSKTWLSRLKSNKRQEFITWFLASDDDANQQTLVQQKEALLKYYLKEKGQDAFFYTRFIRSAEEEFERCQQDSQQKLRLFGEQNGEIRPLLFTYWRNAAMTQLLEESAPNRKERRIERRAAKQNIDSSAKRRAKFATFFEVCLSGYSVFLVMLPFVGPFLAAIIAAGSGLATMIANYILFIFTGKDVGRQFGLRDDQHGVLRLFIDSDGNEVSLSRKVAMCVVAFVLTPGFSAGFTYLGAGAAFSSLTLLIGAPPLWLTTLIVMAAAYVGMILGQAFFSVFSGIIRDGWFGKEWEKLKEDYSYKVQNAEYQKEHDGQELSKTRHVLYSIGLTLKLLIVSTAAVAVAYAFSVLMRQSFVSVMGKVIRWGNEAWAATTIFALAIPGAVLYFVQKLTMAVSMVSSSVKSFFANKKAAVDEPSQPAVKMVGEQFIKQNKSHVKKLYIAVTVNTLSQVALVAPKDGLPTHEGKAIMEISNMMSNGTASQVFNGQGINAVANPLYGQPQAQTISDKIDRLDNCPDADDEADCKGGDSEPLMDVEVQVKKDSTADIETHVRSLGLLKMSFFNTSSGVKEPCNAVANDHSSPSAAALAH